MKTLLTKSIFLFFLSALVLFSGCENENDLFADIVINEGPVGDLGGDFLGNGGNTSQTFQYQNRLRTADYNADITATSGGVFQMIVRDAEGSIVLDKSLFGNREPDSFSGVTSSGKAGTWSVTLILKDFNGDGSFSLSEGD